MKTFDPRTMKLIFYADSQHEWLAVPYKMLVALGIQHDITRYSYRGKHLAYLEGDCDAGTFIDAFKLKYGFAPTWEEKHTNSRSHVRSMPSYCGGEI